MRVNSQNRKYDEQPNFSWDFIEPFTNTDNRGSTFAASFI